MRKKFLLVVVAAVVCGWAAATMTACKKDNGGDAKTYKCTCDDASVSDATGLTLEQRNALNGKDCTGDKAVPSPNKSVKQWSCN